MVEIVIVGPFPDDPTRMKGGVQASVYGLARSLQESREVESVRVVGIPIKESGSAGRRVVDGLSIDYLTMPMRYMASAVVHVPRIAASILGRRNVIAHIHGTGLVQAALSFCLWLGRRHFVWTLHGITELETLKAYELSPSFGNLCRHIFYRWMERLQSAISSAIIVDTPYVAEALRRKTDVHVIPQGVFSAEFENMPIDRPRKPLIVSVGVISPRKGHDKLVRAFAKIAQNHPDLTLAIVGALTDPAYCERVRGLAAELGIADRVVFHVNAHRQLVLDLLSQSSLFALHSQEESQGIALCEALLSSLPVVATAVGGIPYVVTEGSDGYLVPYGDIDAFAAALDRIISDEALRDKMAHAAALNGRRFGWPAICQKIAALYRQK